MCVFMCDIPGVSMGRRANSHRIFIDPSIIRNYISSRRGSMMSDEEIPEEIGYDSPIPVKSAQLVSG